MTAVTRVRAGIAAHASPLSRCRAVKSLRQVEKLLR
jgi:hypothetical protein